MVLAAADFLSPRLRRVRRGGSRSGGGAHREGVVRLGRRVLVAVWTCSAVRGAGGWPGPGLSRLGPRWARVGSDGPVRAGACVRLWIPLGMVMATVRGRGRRRCSSACCSRTAGAIPGQAGLVCSGCSVRSATASRWWRLFPPVVRRCCCPSLRRCCLILSADRGLVLVERRR